MGGMLNRGSDSNDHPARTADDPEHFVSRHDLDAMPRGARRSQHTIVNDDGSRIGLLEGLLAAAGIGLYVFFESRLLDIVDLGGRVLLFLALRRRGLLLLLDSRRRHGEIDLLVMARWAKKHRRGRVRGWWRQRDGRRGRKCPGPYQLLRALIVWRCWPHGRNRTAKKPVRSCPKAYDGCSLIVGLVQVAVMAFQLQSLPEVASCSMNSVKEDRFTLKKKKKKTKTW